MAFSSSGGNTTVVFKLWLERSKILRRDGGTQVDLEDGGGGHYLHHNCIIHHHPLCHSSQSSHLIAHLNLFQGTAAGFSLAPTDELLSVKSLQMKLSTSDNVMITYEIFKTGSSKLFNVPWAECPCTGLQVVFEINKDPGSKSMKYCFQI